MITNVGLYHEPQRKLPWLVRWWGDPDPDTSRQRKYTKSFRYQREARAFQAAKQDELNRGGPRDRPEDVTLKRLIGEFSEARLAHLSYGSREGYQNTMDQLITHFGGGRKVRQIELRHAEMFMATRKRLDGRAGQLSSWSRARHLINCRAIFNAAVSWGYIDRNPYSPAHVQGNSPLHIKPKSRPWQHITPDEFARLLSFVPTPRQRAACWLMYGCGLRAGEVYNLTMDRIDLKHRRVHIASRCATPDAPPFTVKADGQSSESKERSVPIPEAAIPDLAEAAKQAFKAGGFVVLSPDQFATVQENWRLCRAGKGWAGHTHRPWQNRDMMSNLLRDTKQYFRKGEIELTAPFTLHTFRKSFAQNHADAGTPPRTLAKLLGHANTRVTMEFYNRVTDANERAAAQTMDRILGGRGAAQKAEAAG